MGFVHETGSEIFGIETRSESAWLREPRSERENSEEHLFLPYTRKTRIRDEIAELLMRTAGDFYAKSDFEQAEKYKQAAEVVKDLGIEDDERRYSFEASYEWIAEIIKFAQSNESFKGKLAPFLEEK